MTIDKRNFIRFEQTNGGSIKFGGVKSAQVYGKGTISIDGKIKIEDVLYVKGFRHNLLIVIQVCNKRYKLTFNDKGCEIKKVTLED